MKKFLVLTLSLLGMLILSACHQTNQKELSFSKANLFNFTYKKKAYFVTNIEVSQSEISKSLYKFYKIIIVDLDSEEVSSNITSNSTTLVFNNIYQTSDNFMCIGINGKYFKVLSKDSINPTEVLNLQNFEKATNKEDDEFTIDENDSRKIKYMGNIYNISNLSIDYNGLGSYQGVLAEVRVFDYANGNRIPKSRLGKIDNAGSISRQNRVQWIYGRIYSIKGSTIGEKIAIEINNKFRVAIKIKEGN